MTMEHILLHPGVVDSYEPDEYTSEDALDWNLGMDGTAESAASMAARSLVWAWASMQMQVESDVELAQVISRSADAAADLLKEWAERLRSLKGQS
jgi:hypothetical protein